MIPSYTPPPFTLFNPGQQGPIARPPTSHGHLPPTQNFGKENLHFFQPPGDSTTNSAINSALSAVIAGRPLSPQITTDGDGDPGPDDPGGSSGPSGGSPGGSPSGSSAPSSPTGSATAAAISDPATSMGAIGSLAGPVAGAFGRAAGNTAAIAASPLGIGNFNLTDVALNSFTGGLFGRSAKAQENEMSFLAALMEDEQELSEQAAPQEHGILSGIFTDITNAIKGLFSEEAEPADTPGVGPGPGGDPGDASEGAAGPGTGVGSGDDTSDDDGDAEGSEGSGEGAAGPGSGVGEGDDTGDDDGDDGSGGGDDGDDGDGANAWHHGGYVADGDKGTFRDNMPATIQEGEYVIPRYAVDHFGIGFFDALRHEANPNSSFLLSDGEKKGLQERAMRMRKQQGKLPRPHNAFTENSPYSVDKAKTVPAFRGGQK